MHHRHRRACVVLSLYLVLGALAPSVLTQVPASPPTPTEKVVVSGSLRAREYAWNWFGDDPNGEYLYPGILARLGLSQSRKAFDWQVELALPAVFDLPAHAIASGAQGQLGLGATYFAANSSSSNAAMLFLKQGSIRFKGLGGVAGQSLKVGRMEFSDSAEVTPTDSTLAALKRDRIAQRLIGPFGFSDIGRSIDGAQYSLSRPTLNFTFLAGRPTQGVFQVDGWGELDVNLFYGALTGQLGPENRAGEWRVFGVGYRDYRSNVVKTDNRPLASRQADRESIDVATYGAHYIHVSQTPAGPVDLLMWGALQVGSWGALTQRAGAFAGEVGWQPQGLQKLKPWLRGGYDYGSGDDDPNDGTHGTFFQVIPTPRIYARFPFFNMMNTADAFGEVLLRPSKTLAIRADVHTLRLADPHDLWYLGGGAFQPTTFGYTGRASNGQSRLATLYDASADYAVNPHLAIGMYSGMASGGGVTQSMFLNGARAYFGYVELLARF